MRFISRQLILLVFLVVSVTAQAADKTPPAVGTRLQSISVNIKAGSSGYGDGTQGSGTVVLVPVDGKPTAWVITAAHVVRFSRDVQTQITDGEETKVVRYRDAQVVQEIPTEDQSRIVGDTRLDAKIIGTDFARDIAILRVRAVGGFTESARFYLDEKVPVAGTEIYHCGAPGGQEMGGTATLTAGIVSRTGVRIAEFGGSEHGVYDQTDSSGMGGSSGGLLALRSDGRWVGMITLGLRGQDSFHWYVPVRSLRAYCEEVGAMWLIDPKAKPPKEEDIEKIPLENSPPSGSGSSAPALERPAAPPVRPDVYLPPLPPERGTLGLKVPW